VVVPATAYDAKGLLKAAIRDNDPVMFMENTILYNDKGEVPAGDYIVPLGVADVKRAGTDLTIVAYGRAVIHSLQVAEILEKEHKVSAEVVDLRSIRPLDEATILASVRKTHRVLIVDENKPFCGVGAQIAYLIQDRAFDDLDAPIQARLRHRRATDLQPSAGERAMPNPQRILQAALGVLA